MTPKKFKVKLQSHAGMESATLKPPFDVVDVFQRKGRVPVKGTINGFPFRSSLMNMGKGHMMGGQRRTSRRCEMQSGRHRQRGHRTR